MRKVAQFLSKKTHLINHQVKYGFQALGQKSTSIFLNPDNSKFQRIPTEDLQNNMIISQIFRYYEDQVKIYQLPQKELKENEQTSSNCFQHIHIPISTQKDIQDGLIRFDQKSVRTGKLMELFDAIAGEIGYQYIKNKFEEATVVTACVDNIKFVENINPYQDIHIQAYPCYAGNSSVEVQIDLYQKQNEDDPNCPLELKTTSAFLMVARKASDWSPYQLPKLVIKEDIETRLFNQGVLRQQIRKMKRNESVYKKSPKEEQIDNIHEFFINEKKYQSDPKTYKQISDTYLQKVLPMHVQDKNVHGNIFGGFIIREAFELGYLSGIMLNKGQVPIIRYIDDFQFIKPVHVGDILRFESQVCCVKDDKAFVNVECIRMDYDNQPIEKTNELHLIFEVGDKAQKVYPVTYSSAMKYLQAYNHIKLYQETH